MSLSDRHKYQLIALLSATAFLCYFIYNFIFLTRGWNSDSHRITAIIWLVFGLIGPAVASAGPWLRKGMSNLALIGFHTGGFFLFFAFHLLIVYALCSMLPLDDDRPWNLLQSIRKQSFEPALLIFAVTILGGHWWTSRNLAAPIASPQFQKLPGVIAIKTGRKTVLTDWTMVCSIVAHGPYVKVFTGGKFQLMTASMKSIEEQMPSGFVRIHRSCIVNSASIRETRSLLNGDYELTLSNGQVVRASRTYRDTLRSVIGTF